MALVLPTPTTVPAGRVATPGGGVAGRCAATGGDTRIVGAMSINVTDATFETEVLARSEQVPVVVDLWAEWCGPCRTLGPILESVVAQTEGKVVLAKVDTDANPQTAQAFQVQSIPAVHAMVDRKVVASFVGAKGEREVQQFVQNLIPSAEQVRLAELLQAGDEASLRQAVEMAPADEEAVVALAELLVTAGSTDEALALLERLPATATTRQLAARARLATSGIADAGDDGIEQRLGALLEVVKDDPDARTEFLDLLELLGATDPRTVQWRRQLTTRLY